MNNPPGMNNSFYINNPSRNIFIALGGNLGDVETSFCSARSDIDQLSNTSVVNASLLYRTPPIGPAGQPDYCNAVIAIQSSLEPITLLDALQAIEAKHHRIRTEHWGPRTLDLDIIAIDGMLISSDRLTVPHPHMQDRQFVLQPLCDIAANWQHPHLKETTMQLLQTLLATGEPALPRGIVW